jgi:sugar O-acyltransferase (sialic acid O-acetyltransferase NeuD family)
MKDIIIMGAGGFGREVLQWVKDINKANETWNIKGFIDDKPGALEEGCECDYKVIGSISEWQPGENEVFAAAIANPQVKENKVCGLKSRGAVFASVIHPSAYIGSFCKVGEGVILYPGTMVTINASIGNFVALLGSCVGHDSSVGDFSTISAFCAINGHVSVGERAFAGVGVTVIPSKTIGNDAYVGAGSVVIMDVKNGERVFGNPARKMP